MNLDEIRAAQPGATLWDKKGVRGLHVRVAQNGDKNFFLYYRTRDGKQRRPKLGRLGEITLSDARIRAKVLMDKVSAGEDPKGVWDEKRAEMTVAELFARVWDEHWSTERFTRSRWGKEAKKLYEKKVKPTFGTARLSEVTAARVRQWHQGMEDHPYSANRALAVFSKMFSFAEEREIRGQNLNPCKIVKNLPEKKRKRFATVAEMKVIAPLLEKYAPDYPDSVAFLTLLMFTGSRPIAIARATWDQLEEFSVKGVRYGVLTFSGKSTAATGEDERVILPPQAMAALDRLPRGKGKTLTGIQMPRWLWRKIRTEAGCPDLRMRDWRRTFASVGMSGGVGKDVIGSLLNHHSIQTTNVYAKLMHEEGVVAASAIADRLEGMLKAVKSSPSATV